MAKREAYQTELGITDDIFNVDFRWPQKGDKAFQQNANWRANAQLEKSGQTRLVLMADGYKMGADAMVNAASEGNYESAHLVFPILFNYRHFIELSLKYLISTYVPTVGIEANWNTHNLLPLWNSLLEIFDQYGTTDPDEADKVVGSIIMEFAKLDSDSFTNRYPVDKKGKVIELTLEEVDLNALRDVIDGVSGFFSGADGYLDNLQSAAPRDY